MGGTPYPTLSPTLSFLMDGVSVPRRWLGGCSPHPIPPRGCTCSLAVPGLWGAPGPQPAWGAIGPHFSPRDPTTTLYSMSQQNHGYSLAASQTAAGLGCWVARLFQEHHLCERVPTDPPIPALRGCGFPYSCPYTSEMGRSLGWGSAFIPGWRWALTPRCHLINRSGGARWLLCCWKRRWGVCPGRSSGQG